VAYIRVSSVGQNPERQLEGVQTERVFTDTVSGKSTKPRPQMAALLRFVREGDEVVVHSMNRLARNLDDLRRLVRELTDRGVHVRFVQEGLTFSGEDAPMATLLLSTLGPSRSSSGPCSRSVRSRVSPWPRPAAPTKAALPHFPRSRPRSCGLEPRPGSLKTKLARAFGVSRKTVYVCLAGSSEPRPA
jgi:DNA invertase Pin-like site-specific DNA recombinase